MRLILALIFALLVIEAKARDIFILAGTSNVSGRGVLSELPTFPRANRVHVYSNAAKWLTPGAEPVDDATGQIDAVSADVSPAAAAGPSMAFADRLAELRTTVDIGLVPCAKGASKMADWQPDWRRSTLYGSCLARALEAAPMGTIRGIVFHGGEPDTTTLADREGWPALFRRFVEAFRADLGNWQLPVVFGKIGPEPNIAPYGYWGGMQANQQVIGNMAIPKVKMVDSSDLPVQGTGGVHFTTAGYVTLGRRQADAMHTLY